MITGYEPRLSSLSRTRGTQRLSPRRLATLLNVLSPDAISLEAAGVMLHSDKFFVRYNAARLLGQRGDRDARLIMQAALDTGNGPTRASVARQLHRFSWYSGEPMLRQALDDPDERVREGAVYALCDRRELVAYRLLAAVLEHESDIICAAAAWGLRNCQDSAAVPVLAAALRASDPDVRSKALEALGANDTPDAVPVVRAALDDPHPDPVYNAVLSLVELRGDAAVPELATLIRQTHGPRLEPVLRGFFHATNYLHVPLGEHPAVGDMLDALEQAAADPAPEARMAAAWLLAWTRDPHAADLLESAYHAEPDGTVKAHLLRVAVALMSPVGADLLACALDDPDPDVWAMAESLHATGGFAGYDESALVDNPLNKGDLHT